MVCVAIGSVQYPTQVLYLPCLQTPVSSSWLNEYVVCAMNVGELALLGLYSSAINDHVCN